MLAGAVDPSGLPGPTPNSRLWGGALFGAEYFPWRSVSFGAEYQLTAAWTSSSSEFKGTTSDGTSYFDLGISSVAVMMGVYF